jgi:hypothetical protein
MQKLRSQVINASQPCPSNMEALVFCIDIVDKLLGEMRWGDLVVFHGSRMCHVLSELLCVRSQLPDGVGRFNSPVVFIDGGNLFDPYLISEFARLLGLEPEKTLNNIWVSRAFTGYQLTALITEKLSEILDRESSKLVVISDIAALYCDSDIGMLEAKRTFNRVTRFLWNLAREKNLLLLSTSLSSNGRRKRQLEQYLLGRAHIAVRIDEGNPHMKLTLEKHPSKHAVSADLFFEAPKAQFLLEDFIGA